MGQLLPSGPGLGIFVVAGTMQIWLPKTTILKKKNYISQSLWLHKNNRFSVNCTPYMHSFVFYFVVLGGEKTLSRGEKKKEKWTCPMCPFHPNLNHARHYIIISTSKLISRTFPGGLDGTNVWVSSECQIQTVSSHQSVCMEKMMSQWAPSRWV